MLGADINEFFHEIKTKEVFFDVPSTNGLRFAWDHQHKDG